MKKTTMFPAEIANYTAGQLWHKHPKRSSTIYLVVLIAMIVFIALSPFINVDVTRQSRGFIRSTIDNNVLQAMVYGKINLITISENQTVKKGDTLVLIGTEKINEQIDAYTRQIERNKLYINDLTSILNNNGSHLTTAKYVSEYNEYQALIQQQKLQTDLFLKEKNIDDHLFLQKVIAESDHRKTVNNYSASLKKEELIVDQYRRQWHSQIAQFEQENETINANISQLNEEKKLYCITAPVSGNIIGYSGIKKGNFLVPNQTIAQISPSGALIVECYVSPSDIGFVKVGMPLKFQFDAYNYNQWGMGTGVVYEISTDILLTDNQPYFRVKCQLNEPFLKLKNGFKGEIIKGMTLTTRFVLTERTLAQLAFDKVDNWLNPKIKSN